jgi:hypothetical protein
VGDLDRDGFLDAVACDFDALVILWGGADGFGRRSARIEKVVKAAQNCRLIDFNRDGWLDIFVADIGGTSSPILLGGGKGYSLEHSLRVDEAFISNVEFADLDGEGWLDMILLRSYRREANKIDRNDSWVKVRFGGPGGFNQRPGLQFPTSGAFDVAVADLDADGDLDLAVSQYQSRERRNLPVFIFWNDGGGHFSAQKRTSLPGESTSGLLAADFDEDGYTDLLVINHKTSYKEDNHSVDSFLYWGSRRGFSTEDRSYLPGHGPHFLQNVDVGNLATRKPVESYISAPVAVPPSVKRLSYSLEAETRHGSKLRIQIRSAARSDDLEKSLWQETAGPGEFSWRAGDRWLQYRVVFVAGKGYATPYLTKIAFQEVRS